jgi:hypothetical protein
MSLKRVKSGIAKAGFICSIIGGVMGVIIWLLLMIDGTLFKFLPV